MKMILLSHAGSTTFALILQFWNSSIFLKLCPSSILDAILFKFDASIIVYHFLIVLNLFDVVHYSFQD